jgi:ornithine decarboxylase
VRPDAVAVAARWFQAEFKGDVFYAVKANPSPWVIRELVHSGLDRSTSRRSTRSSWWRACAGLAHGLHAPGQEPQRDLAAYFDHGVRTFSLDTHEELAKISTPPARPRTST